MSFFASRPSKFTGPDPSKHNHHSEQCSPAESIDKKKEPKWKERMKNKIILNSGFKHTHESITFLLTVLCPLCCYSIQPGEGPVEWECQQGTPLICCFSATTSLVSKLGGVQLLAAKGRPLTFSFLA